MNYEGFRYIANGKKRGESYFKCDQSKNAFCKATIKVTHDGQVTVIKGVHTHGLVNIDRKHEFRKILKDRAANEIGLLKNIYDTEARNHRDAAALYPWSTAEKLMRHARKSSLPQLPNSIEALAQLFENGQLNRFSCEETLMYRGCVRDEHGHYSIIFGCPQLIRLVQEEEVEEIHADSTFKVVPSQLNAKQLLVLHCMIQNYSIPVCYVLMESKRRPSYDCVIRYIRQNMLQNLNISMIMTDYESALKDTLVSYFPGARASGCWFHHNQAVWRKMKKLEYLNLVNTNEWALKCLRLLLSLPLLPAEEIETGFEWVKTFARRKRVNLDQLFSYYRRFWILRVGVQVLSVNGCPRRTNNNVESFHNQLRLKFSVAHPNLWVFLELCRLSINYHIIVEQLGNGLQPRARLRVKYLLNSARIRTAVEELNSNLITTRQFLERCSYSMANYELRQRNWALGVVNAREDHLNEDEVIEPENIVENVGVGDDLTNNVEMAVEPENIVENVGIGEDFVKNIEMAVEPANQAEHNIENVAVGDELINNVEMAIEAENNELKVGRLFEDDGPLFDAPVG